jgi:phospholipid/cholesterol/gamma-HCH transport system permease protein
MVLIQVNSWRLVLGRGGRCPARVGQGERVRLRDEWWYIVSPLPVSEEHAIRWDARIVRLLRGMADLALAPFAEIGVLWKMLVSAVLATFRPPFRLRNYVSATEFVGIGSIFIVALTGFFTGAVLGLQLVDNFRKVGLENQTSAVVGFGLARELGPVFTALMVSSRAGSAMAAQLGSMRVSNQIDALKTMAVHPIQYLVSPRIFAGLLTVPMLTAVFNVIAIFGAWLVSVKMLGMDSGIFIARLQQQLQPEDLTHGFVKAAVFGIALCLIACRQGYHTTGGAEGVGRATNRAVVHSAIAILALDYLITAMALGQGLF